MASHLRRSDAEPDRKTTGRSESHRSVPNGGDEDVIVAPVGRHASHHVRPSHGTDASVTGAFQRLDPDVTDSFVDLANGELRPIDAPARVEDDAPRPIGVDPTETGSFERITPEMAARAVTRENAADVVSASRVRRGATQPSSRQAEGEATDTTSFGRRLLVAGIAIVVLAAVAAGIIAVLHATSSTTPPPSEQPEAQTQAPPDGSVTFAGTTYALVDAGDGTHVLTARTEGSDEPIGVASINGDPVQLLLYEDTIIIPETYGDGTWDVIAYTPGGEAIGAQVVDGKGAPVHGEGSITDAHIEGMSLIITDTTGAVTTVALG